MRRLHLVQINKMNQEFCLTLKAIMIFVHEFQILQGYHKLQH